MSNGDSLDGFVFPPFIPAAAARPASPPAPAPQPSSAAEEPPAAPLTAAPGRTTMPWDVETPIVSERAAQPQAPTGQGEDEDLPWLERPAPREAAAEAPPAEAPAAPAAPAQDEAFPDWLAWDDRATDDARPELDAVAPVEGLQDFAPVDDIGFLAPAPAVEWQEAAPAAADRSVDALEPSDWLLGAPEAAEPPTVAEPAAEVTFASPAAAAAAEPAFDVTVEDDALTFAAAAPAAADHEPATADDQPAAAIAESPFVAFDDEPAAAVAESPFVGFDDEPAAAIAEPESLDEEWQAVPPAAAPADTHPFVADTEAVLSAEPDPFTAAALDEAEAVAPVEAAPAAPFAGTAAGGVFTDVAARLEDIARTLRERPDDLLSGSASDPLALLVAGYVMGYGARR